jgi:hypothetical protein
MKPNVSRLSAASASPLRLAALMPRMEYVPTVGLSRHPMMFMSVDLPEPDAPMMATNSPL